MNARLKSQAARAGLIHPGSLQEVLPFQPAKKPPQLTPLCSLSSGIKTSIILVVIGYSWAKQEKALLLTACGNVKVQTKSFVQRWFPALIHKYGQKWKAQLYKSQPQNWNLSPPSIGNLCKTQRWQPELSRHTSSEQATTHLMPLEFGSAKTVISVRRLSLLRIQTEMFGLCNVSCPIKSSQLPIASVLNGPAITILYQTILSASREKCGSVSEKKLLSALKQPPKMYLRQPIPGRLFQTVKASKPRLQGWKIINASASTQRQVQRPQHHIDSLKAITLAMQTEYSCAKNQNFATRLNLALMMELYGNSLDLELLQLRQQQLKSKFMNYKTITLKVKASGPAETGLTQRKRFNLRMER